MVDMFDENLIQLGIQDSSGRVFQWFKGYNLEELEKQAEEFCEASNLEVIDKWFNLKGNRFWKTNHKHARKKHTIIINNRKE